MTGVAGSTPSSARTAAGGRVGRWSFGSTRIVDHGDAVRADAFFDEVAFHGCGAGDEVALLVVPEGGGEAVDVADRGRAAEALEPAAPPTGGREMGVEQLGVEVAGGLADPRDGQRVELAADAEGLELHAGDPHFDGGGAAAGDAVLRDLRRIGAAHQAGQEGFGAGHSRGRDDVEHAGWGGGEGGHLIVGRIR